MNSESTLDIVHLFPTLLGVYGDAGNATILRYRAEARGIKAHITSVAPGEPIPASADIYLIGGGEDDGQVAAARQMRESRALADALDAGTVVFAVCAGLQVIGTDFEVGSGQVEPGVGLLELTTRRRETRAVGEVLAEPTSALRLEDGRTLPQLSGYENHGGGTVLQGETKPLAQVVSGVGNGGENGTEGAYRGNVFATYLHGPVLVRNPLLADLLLERATGSALDVLETPYVNELRDERVGYVRSGKLSAEGPSVRR